MKEKLKIIASGRCFFPARAFLWSTKKQAEIARKAGYEGMEFLPTWRVAWEVLRYGKLLAPDEMVASFHRDWRFDRVMEAKRRGVLNRINRTNRMDVSLRSRILLGNKV